MTGSGPERRGSQLLTVWAKEDEAANPPKHLTSTSKQGQIMAPVRDSSCVTLLWRDIAFGQMTRVVGCVPTRLKCTFAVLGSYASGGP